jgi:hypothetical protein
MLVQLKPLQKTKIAVLFFIIALVLSGLTAIPLEAGLQHIIPYSDNVGLLRLFVRKVLQGIKATRLHYPFLFYGYDWLAFAHFMFGVLFIGVYKNPKQNIWIVQFGIIACICIIPFALVLGTVREIPLLWRIVDCCFGVFGGIVLYYILKTIKKI